jgi:hypothetical protein
MACEHKFIDYLTLERLDFEPTTLIVGTFNPAWPKENQAKWFYGRTRNNYFWDILPSLYNVESLRKEAQPTDWKQFCRNNKIAITDLITSIDDAEIGNPQHVKYLEGYKDSAIAQQFKDLKPTDIVALLQKYPTIQYVYLTRQSGISYFDGLWQPIEEYCCQSALTTKTLLTPSGNARFQMGDYKKDNPSIKFPLRNFIFDAWKKEWHI